MRTVIAGANALAIIGIEKVKHMAVHDPTLKELRSIRWVENAVKTDDGYALLTKKDALKITLTHKIREGYGGYDADYCDAGLLETPTVITLPQYWIYLRGEDTRYPFRFSLASKPNALTTRIGIIPQYHNIVNLSQALLPWIPCYGERNDERNSRITYNTVQGWRNKANEVAIYLQSAEPHYGLMWYYTSFAYRLGLVGDEVIEQ